MEHKAECHGQHHVETPGDRPPVKQGVGGSPVLHFSHLGDAGFSRVEDPLAQGVEQDVRRQPGGKHHGTPLEGGILRFFICAQANSPIGGKRDVQGAQEDPKSHEKVAASKLIPQEIADGCHHPSRRFGDCEKQDAQKQDSDKRDHCGDPV